MLPRQDCPKLVYSIWYLFFFFFVPRIAATIEALYWRENDAKCLNGTDWSVYEGTAMLGNRVILLVLSPSPSITTALPILTWTVSVFIWARHNHRQVAFNFAYRFQWIPVPRLADSTATKWLSILRLRAGEKWSRIFPGFFSCASPAKLYKGLSQK